MDTLADKVTAQRGRSRRRPYPHPHQQHSTIAAVAILSCCFSLPSTVQAFIPSSIQQQYTSATTYPSFPLRIATARSVDPSEPDLYQVLGVEPTATRSELKARYIQLARQFHPDAVAAGDTTQANSNHNVDGDEDAADRFNEISTAYQLLRDASQRRVYDRSLAAAQWSETIATAASAASVKALEEFALPLLRRTTATTVAGITAAAATSSNQNSTTSWWKTAVSAVSAASQSIDCMELLEQAERLEDRAVQRYQAAVDVQTQVTEAAQQRLHMAVTTPESGLTATEANLWLEQQKLHEPHDPVIVHEIQPALEELQHSEQQLALQQDADATIQSTLQASRTEQHTAQTELSACQQEEDAAWAAYEQAKHASFAAHHRFTAAANAVFQAERAAHESRHEVLPPLVEQLTEQSERLRRAIVERIVRQGSVDEEEEDDDLQSQHQQRRLELQELRQQEQKLHADATAIEVEAAKLLAESSKLKRRAELLEARRSSNGRAVEDDSSIEPCEDEDTSMEKMP